MSTTPTTPADTPAELTALAQRIADALCLHTGETWTPEPGLTIWQPRIAGPDCRLMLSTMTVPAGRLAIHGVFDDLQRYRNRKTARRDKITVALTRTPADIAKAIARRLLPDFRAELQAATCRWWDARHAEQRRNATAQALAERARARLLFDGSTFTINPCGRPWYTRAEIYSGDSVTLNINGLTPALAERMIDLLLADAAGATE